MIAIVRKIGRILTPAEKRRLGWLMAMDVITSVADIIFLAVLLFIVHLYTGDNWTGKFPVLPAWMADRSSLWPIGIFFLLFCIKNGLSFIIFFAQARFRYAVASRISHRNLLKYLEGSFSGWRDTDSSVHVLKIAQQPIEFCQFELAGGAAGAYGVHPDPRNGDCGASVQCEIVPVASGPFVAPCGGDGLADKKKITQGAYIYQNEP